VSQRRLSVAVAVGLAGLSVPAVAAAAGRTAGWRYVISSASGSVVWRYSGPSGAGVDTVTFRGRPRRGMLHASTTYIDQNSRGCGPVTHSKTRNYQRPKFLIQGSFVVVTWRFPLPSHSYCNASAASIVAQQLHVGTLTQKLPLSRFTCFGLALDLGGQARLSQGGTTGTLTFQGKVLLKRTTIPLTLNP
jgi:hypothetical protein